jgi:hypothetical protein
MHALLCFLRDYHTGDCGAKSLAQSLTSHPQLRVLLLEKAHIGAAGAAALAATLYRRRANGSRLSVSLEPGGDAMVDVARPWSINVLERPLLLDSRDDELYGNGNQTGASTPGVQLHTLRLDGNPLGKSGVQAVCAAVLAAASMRMLGLSDTGIQDANVDPVVQLLARSTLTELNIAHNMITAQGALHIARALSCNSATTIALFIHGNPIEPSCAPAFAEAVIHHHTLARVSMLTIQAAPDHVQLAATCMDDFHLVLLVELAHRRHHSPISMDLSTNKITAGGVVPLRESLSHRLPALTRLDLSENSLGDAGIVALVAAIHLMPALLDVSLANVGCRDTGVLVRLLSHLFSESVYLGMQVSDSQ